MSQLSNERTPIFKCARDIYPTRRLCVYPHNIIVILCIIEFIFTQVQHDDEEIVIKRSYKDVEWLYSTLTHRVQLGGYIVREINYAYMLCRCWKILPMTSAFMYYCLCICIQ